MNIKLAKINILALLLFAVSVFSAQASNVMIQADKQDYNSQKNLMTFDGKVKVNYENIVVNSPKALITTNNEGKPQEATFFKGAKAVRSAKNIQNEVNANIINLSLFEKNIRAQGNTKSRVLENKVPIVIINADSQEFDTKNNIITARGNVVINYKEIKTSSRFAKVKINKAGKPKKVILKRDAVLIQKNSTVKALSFIYDIEANELIAQGKVKSETIVEDSSKILISSNIQEYDKNTNTLMASGNVEIKYKDYIATGPKAMFLASGEHKKPNKIVLFGRSMIQEDIRQVEADRIEITLNPKNFKAEGNVKTRFTQVEGFGSFDKNK